MFCYSLVEWKEIEEQVKYLLKRCLITKISSPFNAPILFVPKPNDTLLDVYRLERVQKAHQEELLLQAMSRRPP